MAQARTLRFLPAIIAVPILLVLIARVIESSNLAAQEFIQTGLLYDKICYMGSYLIVCPYTAPPYEIILLILGALFVIAIWAATHGLRQRSKKS
jgi:uncharacterized membrane protein YdjX (TVP38/TMEM64 family)